MLPVRQQTYKQIISKIKLINSEKLMAMKRIVLIGMLLWSLPMMAQIKSASLTASGLTCSMCSKSIFKALEQVSTIAAVDVDVEKSIFKIQFKDGAIVSLDAVKKAVEDAGFSVASLTVTAAFKGEKVQSDTHLLVGGSTFHFLNVKEKQLSGDVALTIVDKGYLSIKERKKYARYTTRKCFESGETAVCCPTNSSGSNRVYHVAL